MGESLQWIIVLAVGWEPSEEQQAQFIAEVAEAKFSEKVQEFSFVPLSYTKEDDVEIFCDPATTFATFASVSSDAMDEEHILPYLRSELPTTVELAESYNFDIFWEPFSHSEGYKCMLVWLEPGGQGGSRKMVQQIKGIRKEKKEKKEKSRKSLNPIRRTLSPVQKKVIPRLTPTITENDKKGLISPIKPLDVTEQRKITPEPEEGEEWSSFLKELGDEVSDNKPLAPEAPAVLPTKTTGLERAPKLSSSHQTRIPTMYSNFHEEPSRKKSEFGEWDDFLTDLDSEVVESESTHSQPVTPPQPQTADNDWQDFVNDLVPGNSQPNNAGKESRKEQSDSKIFQGRGLFLSQEELALEKAIKKHEAGSPRKSGRNIPTPLPKSIPEKNLLVPTIKRAAPLINPAQQANKPPISSAFSPVQFDAEEPSQSTLRRPIDNAYTGVPMTQGSMRSNTKKQEPEAKIMAQKAKKTRKWVWILLLFLAGATGVSYALRGEINAYWHKTKSGWENAKKQKRLQEKQYQQKYLALEKKIERTKGQNAENIKKKLKLIDDFVQNMGKDDKSKEVAKKAGTRRAKILDEARLYLQKHTTILANQKKLTSLVIHIARYEKIKELKEFCRQLQNTSLGEAIANLKTEKNYRKNFEILIELFSDCSTVNHKLLGTRKCLIFCAHRDILLSTRENNYHSAHKKALWYETKLKKAENSKEMAVILHEFSQQVDVEEKYWIALARGVKKMKLQSKKGAKFTLQYHRKSKAIRKMGKISGSRTILKKKGIFKIHGSKVKLISLTKESQWKLLKHAGGIKDSEKAYGYALLRFSQGDTGERTRREFKYANKKSEYEKKIHYYK